MRYSIEPIFRKYVKGYGFLSFAKNFGRKYGKKLMDTAIQILLPKSKEERTEVTFRLLSLLLHTNYKNT